jgi:hypothetical protein
MKDNIKRDFIKNRKLVIEIRYNPNPRILDERGTLINKLIDSNVILNAHWELGGANITISDKLEQNQSRKKVFIDINRLSFISSAGDTNESFYAGFEKAFKSFKETIPQIQIQRIGCRIQGTYNCESNEYKTIIEKFKKNFPNQFLLEEFPAQDLRFHLMYQNGMYQIGPIRKDDQFIKTEFPYDGRIEHVGFAIDTDNFILREDANMQIKETSIKDVFITSLSVEKSLFEKLKTL